MNLLIFFLAIHLSCGIAETVNIGGKNYILSKLSPDSSSSERSVITTSTPTTTDAIETVANVLSTAMVCYITFRLSQHIHRLINHLIDTIGPSSASNQHLSPNIVARLKPNVTLSSHELEIANSLIFPHNIDMDFKQIGGLKDIKQQLLESVSEPDTAKFDFGDKLMKPTKGILLFGPPGCGKTSLVQALCKRLKRPMLQITPSTLLRKYVGETSQLLRAMFSLATKMEPCVIFVDEMDSLFRTRRDSEQEFDRNLKTEFMQLWDTLLQTDAKVIIVGATNRPQDLDAAVQRRFERSFLVGPPDQAAREAIFKAVLRLVPTDDFDFEAAAIATQGYTPSDIVALCKAATQILLREFKRNEVFDKGQRPRSLNSQDIEEAMSSVFPTTWVAKTFGEMANKPDSSNSAGNSGNWNPPGNKDFHDDPASFHIDDDDDEDE